MAQKVKDKFENTRPKPNHSKNGKVLFETTIVVDAGTDDETTEASTQAVSNLVANSYFEVGDAGSSFSGTDSYGNDIKAITYSKRMPNMSRFDLATAFNDLDGDDFSAAILERQYLYSQEIEGTGENQQIPKFELESKPNDSFDEQYFQHVFNWPTAHTIKSRKIAGLVEKTISCTTPDDTDENGDPIAGTGSTSSTYVQQEKSANFTANLTLAGTDSELYWIVPSNKTDGTSDWTYQKVITDSLGRVTNGQITPSFNSDGNLTASGTGTALATVTLEWDDDPDAYGKAIETVEFGGNIWIRDGGGEVGKTTKTVVLEAGKTYDVKLNGNSGGYTVSGNKLILKDTDGNDTNATFVVDTISNEAIDKIGSPIIYHGGTDDNCIFFNYKESKGGNNSSVSASISHTFNDDANVDIELTSSNSSVQVTSESKADNGGTTKNFKLGRKHYLIKFTNKKVTNPNDVSVVVTSNLTASGVDTNPQLAKVSVVSEDSIRVWFETENGLNTFSRGFTVTLGGLEQGTTDVIAIGDTVNGATITNVVNYVVNTGLRRTVNKHAEPGRVDRRVTESKFISLGYTSSDYSNSQSWIRMNDVNDIDSRMVISGDGLEEGTKVVAVDPQTSVVWLNQKIKSNNLKEVLIVNDEVNRVSKHTLCYATISGGSSFSADSTYTTNNGVQIIVRAGKGIINRSAVVGTYFSFDKKTVKYQPIFYSADPNCEKYVLEEESGDYTLGSILWDDGSKTNSKFLLTRPESKDAYKIASIYLSFTNAPIDIDTYEIFRETFESSGRNVISLYNLINAYATSTLNGKKAVLIEDDVCRDTINLEYFQSYDPFLESESINVAVQSVTESVSDDCVIKNEVINPSNQNDLDVNDRFSEIVSKSISGSSILSKEYYEKLITNEDSLFNRVKGGADSLRTSIPNQRVNNLPPQIEGEDSSGRIFEKNNYRDMPPAMDRVKFFTTDLQFSDDKAINPTIDLDPTTTYNQPVMVFRSKPKWSVSGTPVTSFPIDDIDYTSSIEVTITNDADGYLDTITATNTGIVMKVPVGSTCDDGTATVTADWCTPVKGNDDDGYTSLEFYNRTAWPDNYTIATNWFLPPNLRDLNHKEKPDGHSSLSLPSAGTFPKNIWQPNVNYQMDYYKLFNFRMKELSEMIGETILNQGNPFIDQPLLAKLTKTLERNDTTINVASTVGFFSSGYLIIPKYTKKVAKNETGNYNTYYSYSGEEIIYYGSKTETTFNNCTRSCFGTTPGFESSITAGEMEEGVRYKIEQLGTTVWDKVAGLDAAKVGDVFVAQKPKWFKGSGIVSVFGSTYDTSTPFSDPPSISSYERGFSLAQYTVFSLRES